MTSPASFVQQAADAISSRWPKEKRKDDVSHTVHKILASIADEEERWVSIEDAPFNPRSNRKQWTTDGAKRLVGHQVDNPVSVEEKARAVKDLTRDDDVAVQVTASLLSRPETASSMPAAERVRVVKELTRDDEVATSVTSELLQRPASPGRRCATTTSASPSTGASSTTPNRPASGCPPSA